MDLVTWQWEPAHCQTVADLGLTNEDRARVNRIAAEEGVVDPGELEEALIVSPVFGRLSSIVTSRRNAG